MSNVFPDPSASPWTNPDTGDEFIYDTTIGCWVPADEYNASPISETLDSVCQNDPVTDVDVTVGSLIYMDDGEDAYNGGSHELEAKVPEGNEINKSPGWLNANFGTLSHAYSPELNVHVLAGGPYASETGYWGALGSTVPFNVPDHNGQKSVLGALVWAENSFYGFNTDRDQVWESTNGINWSVTDNVTNTYNFSVTEISFNSIYNPHLKKIVSSGYDSGSSSYYIALSTPGEYFTEEKVYFPALIQSSGGSIVRNAPILLITTSSSGDTVAVYSSDMGASWETVSSSANHNITSTIRYVDGEYWARIDCKNSAVSTDLVSWEVRPAPYFIEPVANQIPFLPVNRDKGIYLSCQNTIDACGIDEAGWHPVLFSRDGINWGGVSGKGEIFDYHYDGMFIDEDDNLVVVSMYGDSLHYLANFTKVVLDIDTGGLYFNGDRVATSENLQPLFQEINSHTDQIAELDGEKLPHDILTLPTQAI